MRATQHSKTVDINDLPTEYREIAEIIGFDNYMKLLEYCGGSYLYFPTIKTALKQSIFRRIVEEYDGMNKVELIRKYGISESSFYRIIKSTMGRS